MYRNSPDPDLRLETFHLVDTLVMAPTAARSIAIAYWRSVRSVRCFPAICLIQCDNMAMNLNQLAALDWNAAAAVVKDGLSSNLLRKLADQLKLGLEEMAVPLHLTTRTLHRRMEQGRLSLDESERLLAITRIVAQATEILGSEAKAVHWLKSPVPALGGKTPLACAETQVGLREVEDVLTRVQDVVYS